MVPNIFIINQQAIMLAVSAIQRDDARTLEQMGLAEIDSELARQLKELQMDHLSCLVDFRGSLLHCQIDKRQLKMFVNMASEKTREDDQINKAIRAGIRQPVLEELKGVTRRDFTGRRERMEIPEHSKGRIENLNEDDEISVLRAWTKHQLIEDPLTRLLAVYDDTQISLDRAWIAIKHAF